MVLPVVQSSYDSALDFLVGRINYEQTVTVPYSKSSLRLERMQRLLALLGNPQQALKVVHIAGTKGKGSTALMVSSILQAAGYRTGLYSSPHLDRVEERFVIDGEICPPQRFVALVDAVRTAVEQMDREATQVSDRPTYFEITTAMAMFYFAMAGVDTTVLEVGLGGRLDSTNTCLPKVCVITSISFDHTKQLGNTLDAIAREKAGIIKPGVPVVSGVIAPEPRDAITQVAAQHQATLAQAGEHFTAVYHQAQKIKASSSSLSNVLGTFDFQYHGPHREHSYQNLPLTLLGEHQAANAAVALATVAELRAQGWEIEESAVRRGLESVRWPARIEVIGTAPLVIVDAAHNVAAIDSLVKTLKASVEAERKILIFATTQEKDCSGMLQTLLPYFDTVLLTQYTSNPRGLPVPELMAKVQRFAASGQTVKVCDSVGDAWQQAKQLAGPNDLICATGSFFLAAELRKHLEALRAKA